MVKYWRRMVPHSCQIPTKTSEMNDSAQDVFKKPKIIEIGSVEIILEQFQFSRKSSFFDRRCTVGPKKKEMVAENRELWAGQLLRPWVELNVTDINKILSILSSC